MLLDVDHLMNAMAQSIDRSLDYYWPADAEGDKDLCEANLVIHLANALLAAQCAVFAEVDHPRDGVQGIDLLAITSDRECFLAVEIKRHLNKGMTDSDDDVERLAEFRLNDQLRQERCGDKPLEVLTRCQSGTALVAGLKWSGAGNEEQADSKLKEDPVAKRVLELGGKVGDRILVRRYDTCKGAGAYYLQYGYFPIQIR